MSKKPVHCFEKKKKRVICHAESIQSWLFRTKAKNLPCYKVFFMANSFQNIGVIFACFYFMRYCNKEELTN